MEQIISPWWFYLIGVTGYLSTTLKVVALVLFLMEIPVTLIYCDFGIEYAKKICIRIAIVAIALLILSAFIPDKQTAYAMLAASVITPDNIQAVQGNIVDFITNVAKSIQEVK